MTFLESLKTCLFDKPFTFSGRASRSEYWSCVLFYCLGNFLVPMLTISLLSLGPMGIFLIIFFFLFITAAWRRLLFYCLGSFLVLTLTLVIFLSPMSLFSIRGFFLTIFLIIFFLPFITVTWRRLHDMNRSGWWSVLIYIVHCSFVLVINVSSDLPRNVFWIPDQVLFVISFGIFLWPFLLLAWFLGMGIKKGTSGPNQFGEDPLQTPHSMNPETESVADTNHPAPAGHPSVGGEK